MSTEPPTQTDTPHDDQAATERKRLATIASRQRFKPQLSCTFCRARKLKCDRNHPCKNCIRRDHPSTCMFVHAGLREKFSSIQQTSGGRKDPKDMQSRIQHLEELVVSLMHRSAVNNTSTPDSQESVKNDGRGMDAVEREMKDLRETSGSFGRITIEDDQPGYVGAGHWAAILDSITGLKGSLDNNYRPLNPERVPNTGSQTIELLSGSVPKATKAEILAALPPRHVTDQMVNRIYNISELVLCIHVPTFKKQYESFWANPNDTPVMWIGLLYAHLCIILYLEVMPSYNGPSSLVDQPLRDSHATIQIFREKIVQCLVLGNYTEPTAYTVETLVMYFFTEHFRPTSSPSAACMLVGLIVRSAMRLGYHRDARHSPNISILQGEMQRRIWATIMHVDLQTSCRVGLPRMVKEGMFDTETVRNLYDEDFDENTTILPPARPLEERTPGTHSLVKHSITRVYGMIVDETNSTHAIPYEKIMRLDGLLEEAHNQVPDFMKVHSMDDLEFTKAPLVLAKFSVDLYYQSARCQLHRKYVTPQEFSNGPIHAYSAKACMNAAMQILHSQSFMYDETRPNKRLHEHKWRVTALMTHDFLLAAMLICVHLKGTVDWPSPGQTTEQDESPISWTRAEMLDALDSAYRIWDEASQWSKDALKAANVLKRTLTSIRGAKESKSAQIQPPGFQTTSSPHDLSILGSVPHTMGAPSSGFTAAQGPQPWQRHPSTISNSYQPIRQGPFESLLGGIEDMMNPSMELDWELWDNHFYKHPPDLWSSDAATFTFPDFVSQNTHSGSDGGDLRPSG